MNASVHAPFYTHQSLDTYACTELCCVILLACPRTVCMCDGAAVAVGRGLNFASSQVCNGRYNAILYLLRFRILHFVLRVAKLHNNYYFRPITYIYISKHSIPNTSVIAGESSLGNRSRDL